MSKVICLFLLLLSANAYGLPFKIVPKEGTQLPTSLALGSTATAYYTIYNNTSAQRNNNFVKYLPPNVTQVTAGGTYPDTCGATFNLAPGASCTLQLSISGSVNANDSNPKHHLFVCFPEGRTCAGTYFPLNVKTMADYVTWINGLRKPEYKVVQGNAYLMTNTACPLFVSIFDSCFGQNPAAPYIIPQPPIEDSYVDPYYATPLNTPGPQGETNIIYRLSDQDALVTIISYPPQAAFLGYQSYVFSRETSYYANITPPRARTVSPDPSRYEIFGSLGNDVNNVIVQNQYGFSPWNSVIAVYITTSNTVLANTLIANAQSQGISLNSIFVEPVGSNVITGNGSLADDMITLMRYAIPESTSDANTWTDALSRNVLVYKVSNDTLKTLRFGSPQYTPHTVNTAETTFSPSISNALQQLAALLQTYLNTMQSPFVSEYQPLEATTTVNNAGVPEEGLVGSYCIEYGTNCEGDDQDTSTYAFLLLNTLGPEETAFVVGVNHNVPNLDNTRYVSIGLYDAETSSGIASSSQTNPNAVGFDSGSLTGSAQAVLTALGIVIPPEDIELTTNLSNLYVAAIARDINNPTIAAASAYCIDLMGTSLIPLGEPISITERSYIVPGTTTGGNVDYMLYPLVVAASHDFNAP
jgi:hypothetical protein